MSKAAARDPDRKREIRPIDTSHVRGLLAPGAKAYRMGSCRIIVSRDDGDWHLSISREDRLPSWEEVREARYALIPDEVTMAMLLPPQTEYVNAHEFCFHLWQIPSE